MNASKPIELNILYIEDDLIVKESITNILKLYVSEVFTAEDGIEALEIMKNKNIDIIVTDIKLPKMNGLDFLEEARKINPKTPVILTTAFDEIEYLKKAIKLKVDSFIQKPIDLDDLINHIKKLTDELLIKKELLKKRIQLEQYRKAVDYTNFTFVIDSNEKIIEINEKLHNYLKNTIKGHFKLERLKDLIPEDIKIDLLKKVYNFEIYHDNKTITIKNTNFLLNLTALATDFSGDKINEVTFIVKDLTEIVKEKDKKIKNLYLDLTTKLPNKHALLKLLSEDENDTNLFMVSLDEFSKYTFNYGNNIADEILIQTGKELNNFWPFENEHKVFKLDYNLFAITTKKIENFNYEKAKNFANILTSHFEAFIINVNDINIDITITIGASCNRKGDLYLESLIALNHAKMLKQHFMCYSQLNNPKEIYAKNITIQQKIKKALEEDKIITHLQPIVDRNKNTIKYESLARMIDPDDPSLLIYPNDFIKAIGSSKYYTKFTKKIIEKSLLASKIVKSDISINLSFLDISNPEIIIYLEQLLINKHPYEITFEFLESEGLENIEKTKDFCKLMKYYGAKIAIDDFGAGYSNYDYFFDIPIDIIKIDASLVKRVTTYKGYLLLKNLVDFCSRLNIQVVAEFVENELIFDKLKSIGVDLYQGYLFSKPMPAENFLES